MTFRTDLAAESAAYFGKNLPAGIHILERRFGLVNLRLVRAKTPEAARALGKAPGDYYTVEGRRFSHAADDREDQLRAAAFVLRRLLPQQGMVLTVGLGNRTVTADALGPLTAQRVLVTRHLPPKKRNAHHLRETAVLCPGVLPQTGTDAAELARWWCEKLRPAAVVAVDSLSAASADRLGRTIQISDTGVEPGSGVCGDRLPLNRDTLGCPVIAVGVPMVMDARTEGLMVTPHDADLLVHRAAACIGEALNAALQPGLTRREIRALSD